MKKSRVVAALILNLLVIAALAFGFLNHYFLGLTGPAAAFDLVDFFQWYTNDAAALLAVVSLFLLIEDFVLLAGKKPSKFLAVLELIAVSASLVSLVLVAAYLAPQANDWTLVYGFDYNLYVLAVAPILGLVSFIVANRPHLKWTYAFLGLLVPVAYCAAMIVLSIAQVIPAVPYGFLDVTVNELVPNIIAGAILVLGPFLLALIAIILHNIGSKEEAPAAVAEEEETAEEEAAPETAEAAPTEATPEEKPAESKPEEKPADAEKKEEKAEAAPSRPEAPAAAPASPSKPAARVYRVKKSGGKWQVILVGAENKVVKAFDTQSEAIAYSRGLLESRGKMVRVTKVKK